MKDYKLSLAFILILLIYSCTTIDLFDQRAYELAIDVKVEAQLLISSSSRDYTKFDKEIYELKLKSLKAYEYAKARNKNEESIKQWEIMVDPERDMLFGTLKMWKEKGKLSPTFANLKSDQIAKGIEQIIELEAGKRKVEE